MEARIRLTTEMLPAHIARVDRDGVYTYTNRRLSSLLPGRQSDIVGLSFEEALGPRTAARLRPALERVLLGDASVLEFTEDDTGRRIRTALTPDQSGPGEPITGVYLLSTDLTEEAQARAALAQTGKRELAAQLTSGLAHDFANLLTIILGLQGRLDRMPLPMGAHELTGATKAAARRGGDLLDKIARMSGPHDMREAPTVLADFLATLAPLARATLPPEITLTLDNHVAEPALMLDTGSLQDSLLNLVLNARDAIGAGPGQIAIVLTAVQETWLEIAVTDTGPGFTEEALARALDPFFTTQGKEGSGLGLSMVYDLTKLSGGQVRLGNQPGGGASVSLRLPLRPAEAEARPRLILLVEDTPEIRATVRDALTGLGHQVIEAATADEALSLADIPGIDWVLSDIRLGPADGVDLLGRIARKQPALKLALMTSLPDSDTRRAAGAQRWPVLPKPVDAATLHALLAQEAAA
jgi:signal transduction histidine kinase